MTNAREDEDMEINGKSGGSVTNTTYVFHYHSTGMWSPAAHKKSHDTYLRPSPGLASLPPPFSMEVSNIAISSAKIGGALGAVGLMIGAIVGFMGERKRVNSREALKTNLPAVVVACDEMREPLLRFAETHGAHMESLQRVARRCAAMLLLYERLIRADPRTVEMGIVTATRKIEEAVHRYMREFFRASNIQLIEVKAGSVGSGTRRLEPANTDLRTAYTSLMVVIDAYTFNATNLVKAKFEEAASMVKYLH